MSLLPFLIKQKRECVSYKNRHSILSSHKRECIFRAKKEPLLAAQSFWYGGVFEREIQGYRKSILEILLNKAVSPNIFL